MSDVNDFVRDVVLITTVINEEDETMLQDYVGDDMLTVVRRQALDDVIRQTLDPAALSLIKTFHALEISAQKCAQFLLLMKAKQDRKQKRD
jgi:hypothetical protein